MSTDLDPHSLSLVYRWIDTIPLDRPKKNISRDFSDGVLMSQVLFHFFPKLVDLHNYSASNGVEQKNYNWKTLNQKVFKKMGFMISPVDIDAVVQCKRHAIERILLLIQVKIEEYQLVMQKEESIAALSSSPTLPPIPAPAPVIIAPPPQPKIPSPRQQQQPIPAQSGKKITSSSQKKSSAAANGQPTRKGGAQQQQTSPTSQQQQSSQPAPSSSTTSAAPSKSISSTDKDATILDLRETVDILQLKVSKLEQLLRLKNSKIESLQKKLDEAMIG